MIGQKIAIIGGGNLGRAIAEGLLSGQLIKPENITVTRRKLQLIDDLKEKGVKTTSNNPDAVKNATVVIVAVKPRKIIGILEEIRESLSSDAILISAVTGVKLSEILEALENKAVVFRAMPNTAIAIHESMTCVCTVNGSEEKEKIVFSIFNQLGKTILVDEELMDASTVLAACGIAFALRFIRAAAQGGIEIGFDSHTAHLIASQTVRGAAGLLIEGTAHPETEIDKVTTPQGYTIAGLNEMEHQGFSSSLIKGIVTSFNKIN
ncbi:pyrroline-5-carboxylate reductase [Bacteroidota bacterium]